LKYVVLASILCSSTINYADTREAKVFKDDPEIVEIMNLRTAYEANDIVTLQNILSKSKILEDTFIKSYLDDLLRNVRMSALVAKIRPYKSVALSFLAAELKITQEEVKGLLVELILEQQIKGKIDQMKGFLELASASKQKITMRKHAALNKWANTLMSLHGGLTEKVR
jgi:COP9 signalosome complex subunit 2